MLAVFYNYAENKEAGMMAGLTLKQVVTYVWVAQAVWTMQPMSIDSDILGKINSGDVGIELCRPIDLYFHWFARIAAGRLAPLFWRGSLTLLCGMLMPPAYRLSWPASLPSLLWTVVSLVCAFLLCTALGAFVTTVRLNIAWGDGPVYMFMFIGSILSERLCLCNCGRSHGRGFYCGSLLRAIWTFPFDCTSGACSRARLMEAYCCRWPGFCFLLSPESC